MSLAIQKLSETLQKAEDVLKGLAEPDNSKQDDLDEELVKKYRTRKFNAELLSPSDEYETKEYNRNKVMAGCAIDLIRPTRISPTALPLAMLILWIVAEAARSWTLYKGQVSKLGMFYRAKSCGSRSSCREDELVATRLRPHDPLNDPLKI